MIQINIKTQFIIMAVSLVAFLALQFTVGFGWSFIPLIILIAFLVSYILFGTISSTSKLLQAGDAAAAEKNLKLTFKPNWLLKFYRSYYYQLQGFIAIQQKKMEEGEALLIQAREMGLPTDNDKATVALQLASLSFNKRNFQKATTYIREIKSLNVSEPVIMEQVKQMEQAIRAKPSMAQIMQMQGMRGAKGKVQRQEPGAKPRRNNRKPSSKRKKRK
ncbi:MAG: hypothetical protein AB8G11_03015 [Saprospiraceae bacterium]